MRAEATGQNKVDLLHLAQGINAAKSSARAIGSIRGAFGVSSKALREDMGHTPLAFRPVRASHLA